MFNFPLWKIKNYKWNRQLWDKSSTAQQFLESWSAYLFRVSMKKLFAHQKAHEHIRDEGDPNSSPSQWNLVLHFIASNYDLDTAEIQACSFCMCLTKKCKRSIHVSVNYNNIMNLLLACFSHRLTTPLKGKFLHSWMKTAF